MHIANLLPQRMTCLLVLAVACSIPTHTLAQADQEKDKAASQEKKPDEKKADAKPADKKPDAKPDDAKAADKKPDASKADAKPADKKPEDKKPEDKKPDDAAKAPVAINTKCPVSGEDVEAKIVSLFSGKAVGFCCEDCQKKFLKDPTKFKDKIVADAKK